ncbi:glycoside hydrolase family 127 protein [Bacteroidota bacterium]
MKSKKLLSFIFLYFICVVTINSQDRLYPNEFSLSDVKLLEGSFKHAQDLNVKVILEYEPDRFLAPYLKVAGLTPKADNYENWESDGLDGHVGGHYLSSLAIHYASTGNLQLKKRMENMISELKKCQEANAKKYPDWGIGYVGGVPNSEKLWPGIKEGNTGLIWNFWVPWYNVHKMYAGLRDAWLYTGNEDAKEIFLKFCDWAINITSGLSDEQMEQMLNNEYGGMNEVLADAYQISGEIKYLNAAKRFSHKFLLEPMSEKNDNLDNLHANTQVPKAIGFQRIGELSHDDKYSTAGLFFWETVVTNRSIVFGGNSRKEFFPSVESCSDFTRVSEGIESCNTHNMLKLTEGLFRIDPKAVFVDFYERALINHIISTQHPEHGGYVYFTSARPRHYRVYSAPNKAMWCCVGTGLENHGKYGQFIYTHKTDSLYLNLYIASKLNWKDKEITITQETKFPEEELTKLTVNTKSDIDFTLMVRHPYWVSKSDFKIFINDEEQDINSNPSSYTAINRIWKNGDVVKIVLPMKGRLEKLINVPDYYAFMYGPVLLGAKTGTEEIPYFIAGTGRWEHIAYGKLLPLNEAPIIIEDNISSIPNKLIPEEGKKLTFSTSNINILNADGKDFILEPFYKIHDSRYMMYWYTLTNKGYKEVLDSLAKDEEKRLEIENRTIDFVQPG